MQIYYIWYGGWGNLNNKGTASRPTTVKVLTDLAQSIGGTPWFNIGTTYTDGNGPVVNAISYGGRAGITAGSKCWQVCLVPWSLAVTLLMLPAALQSKMSCTLCHSHVLGRLSTPSAVARVLGSQHAAGAGRCVMCSNALMSRFSNKGWWNIQLPVMMFQLLALNNPFPWS